MDFSFSEEQQLLRYSVRRFLDQHYDFESRRKVAVSDSGWRREIWQRRCHHHYGGDGGAGKILSD